jgi:hypothetical protein
METEQRIVAWQWVIEEVSGEIKKFLESYGNVPTVIYKTQQRQF